MPYTLVVCAAIVDDLDRPRTVLAARRVAPSAHAGGWELPGGKVEPGETPEAALHRELAEELGVTVRLGAELPCPTTDDALWPLTGTLRLRAWLAVVTAGEPRPLVEHDELALLGPGHWHDVAWLAGDAPVVAELERRHGPAAPACTGPAAPAAVDLGALGLSTRPR